MGYAPGTGKAFGTGEKVECGKSLFFNLEIKKSALFFYLQVKK